MTCGQKAKKQTNCRETETILLTNSIKTLKMIHIKKKILKKCSLQTETPVTHVMGYDNILHS